MQKLQNLASDLIDDPLNFDVGKLVDVIKEFEEMTKTSVPGADDILKGGKDALDGARKLLNTDFSKLPLQLNGGKTTSLPELKDSAGKLRGASIKSTVCWRSSRDAWLGRTPRCEKRLATPTVQVRAGGATCPGRLSVVGLAFVSAIDSTLVDSRAAKPSGDRRFAAGPCESGPCVARRRRNVEPGRSPGSPGKCAWNPPIPQPGATLDRAADAAVVRSGVAGHRCKTAGAAAGATPETKGAAEEEPTAWTPRAGSLAFKCVAKAKGRDRLLAVGVQTRLGALAALRLFSAAAARRPHSAGRGRFAAAGRRRSPAGLSPCSRQRASMPIAASRTLRGRTACRLAQGGLDRASLGAEW